jgi:serine/threonine protein kinase/glyoxylase-like metal-dependent hydrolase (beta-lactamase superfamily II)
MPARELRCPLCAAHYEDKALVFCPRDGARLRTSAAGEGTLTGVVVQDRYRVGALLGTGGMSHVYEAEHLATGRSVALKVLQPRLVSDPAMVDRFRHEARLLALVTHPNVVTIEDFGTMPDGSLFMVMELLRGRSLSEVLEDGRMAPSLALDIAVQICDAVQALHDRGIVHRDLKPGNVHLVRSQGGRSNASVEVKVLDFGISKLVSDEVSDLTRTGAVFGTPEYMSPEQALGKPVDARADIYSIGVLVYRMLLGRVPFTADSFLAVLTKHLTEAPEWPARAEDPDLPEAAQRVVMKALQKAPSSRYESAAAFGAALQELRSQLGRALSAETSPDETTEVMGAGNNLQDLDYHVEPLATAKGADREVVQIAHDTWWVGRRQDALLECNVYLRSYRSRDTRLNVLIDPGAPADLDVIAGKVGAVVGAIGNVDLIFINHQDPDVAANTAALQQANPRIHVLCAEDTWRLARFYGLKPQCYSAVDHFRDQRMRLATGHEVLFVPTPFCHFRGAVMYYDIETRVLFSGDLFGGLTRSPGLLSRGDDWEDIDAFHQIYMPTNLALRRAVARIRLLDPQPVLIAPQHGALIDQAHIEPLLRRIENLPVGLDLDAQGPQTTQYCDALSLVVRGLSDVLGRAKVETCLRSFCGDGTFPNLFLLGDDLSISSVKIEVRAAARALMRSLRTLVPDERLDEFWSLVREAEARYGLRLPVAAMQVSGSAR